MEINSLCPQCPTATGLKSFPPENTDTSSPTPTNRRPPGPAVAFFYFGDIFEKVPNFYSIFADIRH